MLLGFSSNAYTRFDIEEACRRIAGHGYRAVEILCDVPHAYPTTFGDAKVRQLKHLLDDLGLVVSNINANTAFGFWSDAPPEPFFEPSLVSDDPRLRDKRLDLTLRCLDIAAGLGARNISITTGKPLGSMSPEACRPVLDDYLGRILERAEQLGVDVGIECEPGLLLENSVELAECIARIASPRLGANLDIGHAVVSGEDPREVVRRLAGRIWNLHVEDIRGGKHYHLIPGQGDINFAAVVAALNEVGYDRTVTVELYTYAADPDRAASETMKVLGPLFK
ncbi:MAG: sugar phosphate isomerase/epimerase [Planctomycetes bacterium]|nr:sugar phosphate isomerase/epimerase [Planctomycetota bacterium]